LKITVLGQASDVEVIRELLSPWNVSFTSFDEAEVAIIYNEKRIGSKKTIVIPSDSSDFLKLVKDIKSKVAKKRGERVSVAATSQTVLTFTPQMLYYYDGPVKSAFGDTPHTAAELSGDLIFLTLDIIKEYNKILDETLNAKPSTLYNLFTGFPVPYTLAPKKFRDLFMRKHRVQENLTLCDKLPLDALRFILVTAIEKLSRQKLHRKTWNGKKYACLMTHDVDTRKGLQNAKQLKKLEEKYDVPSAWYIPLKHYELDLETIKELANYGEIGAHDTKHDGKLAQIPKRKLIERVLEAKQTLERIVGQPIEGFRAPILQHNIKIIQALEEAGYAYDTSIPTWEPKQPYTMKPHGIGTTCPLALYGLTEIPVTLTQDHQLLYVLGLTPEEAIRKWLDMISVIKSLGGLCTFLVHPDYKLADQKLNIYEELVNTITSDHQAWITLPSKIGIDTENEAIQGFQRFDIMDSEKR
jgi:peptidoglycan/xylan/chitin deacetylase (PgdA/CDA1 family)